MQLVSAPKACFPLAVPFTSPITALRQIADVFSKRPIRLEFNEDDDGPMVYCAVEKQSHHRTVEDLLKKAEPVPPPDDAPVKEKMAFRLKTQAGRTVYKKRKETVEPVFGIIKTILGFRGFLLRGLDKVSIEWDLITAAYNFKRLHKLCGGNLLEFTKILPQRS